MTSPSLPMPGVPRDTARRIGLLGGSFNPAHEGHRHISLEALKRLGLDEVWWLVSPQNPLKTGDGMEPLATRVARARKIAGRHPHIRVEPRCAGAVDDRTPSDQQIQGCLRNQHHQTVRAFSSS